MGKADEDGVKLDWPIHESRSSNDKEEFAFNSEQFAFIHG